MQDANHVLVLLPYTASAGLKLEFLVTSDLVSPRVQGCSHRQSNGFLWVFHMQADSRRGE
jgi:hypothetical protein